MASEAWLEAGQEALRSEALAACVRRWMALRAKAHAEVERACAPGALRSYEPLDWGAWQGELRVCMLELGRAFFEGLEHALKDEPTRPSEAALDPADFDPSELDPPEPDPTPHTAPREHSAHAPTPLATPQTAQETLRAAPSEPPTLDAAPPMAAAAPPTPDAAPPTPDAAPPMAADEPPLAAGELPMAADEEGIEEAQEQTEACERALRALEEPLLTEPPLAEPHSAQPAGKKAEPTRAKAGAKTPNLIASWSPVGPGGLPLDKFPPRDTPRSEDEVFFGEVFGRCASILRDCCKAGGKCPVGAEQLLQEVASPGGLAAFEGRPGELVFDYLGFVSSLGRWAMDRYKDLRPVIQRVFSVCREHHGRRYGFLPAADLAVRPETSKWLEDALCHLEDMKGSLKARLMDLKAGRLEEVYDILKLTGAFVPEDLREARDEARRVKRERMKQEGGRPKRRELRMFAGMFSRLTDEELEPMLDSILGAEPGEEEVVERPAPSIPAAWLFWPLTQNKAAVLVGAGQRPAQLEALRKAFRFASVEWIDGEAKPQVLQLLLGSLKPKDNRVFLVQRGGGARRAPQEAWAYKDRAILIEVEPTFEVDTVRRGFERHGLRYLGAPRAS